MVASERITSIIVSYFHSSGVLKHSVQIYYWLKQLEMICWLLKSTKISTPKAIQICSLWFCTIAVIASERITSDYISYFHSSGVLKHSAEQYICWYHNQMLVWSVDERFNVSNSGPREFEPRARTSNLQIPCIANCVNWGQVVSHQSR